MANDSIMSQQQVRNESMAKLQNLDKNQIQSEQLEGDNYNMLKPD